MRNRAGLVVAATAVGAVTNAIKKRAAAKPPEQPTPYTGNYYFDTPRRHPDADAVVVITSKPSTRTVLEVDI